MNKILKNPILTTFLGSSLLLFLMGAFSGIALQALQLLFVPYTYDFSRGVGKTANQWVSGGLLGLQAVIVVMAFSVPSISHVLLRRVLWGIGIFLVFVYLLVTILAYVSTGLH